MAVGEVGPNPPTGSAQPQISSQVRRPANTGTQHTIVVGPPIAELTRISVLPDPFTPGTSVTTTIEWTIHDPLRFLTRGTLEIYRLRDADGNRLPHDRGVLVARRNLDAPELTDTDSSHAPPHRWTWNGELFGGVNANPPDLPLPRGSHATVELSPYLVRINVSGASVPGGWGEATVDVTLIERPSTRWLNPGVYVQIYLNSMPHFPGGDYGTRLERYIDALAAIGVKGIVFHPYEATSNAMGLQRDWFRDDFTRYAQVARRLDLHALAGIAPGVRTVFTARQMGEIAGEIASHPLCEGLVVDAEDAWDRDAPAEALEDARDTLAFAFALRRRAPDQLVIDQPWPDPAPGHHGSFPWREFAWACDLRAPQFYYCDHSHSTFASLQSQWTREWRELEATKLAHDPRTHARVDLVRTRIVTIQGYGWRYRSGLQTALGLPPANVELDRLFDEASRNSSIIIWCQRPGTRELIERDTDPGRPHDPPAFPTKPVWEAIRRITGHGEGLDYPYFTDLR